MHIFLQTNSQLISLKPAASMTFSFPLPIPVSIRLSLIGHWQYSWTYDRFLPVIRSVRLGWLCTRRARPPTMGVPARNTAVPSASPKPVFALVTTKTGTTARKTGAAPSIRPFQQTTDFPLTAAVSISSGLTPCGRSVSVTIPASNPQVRNGCGRATAPARRISTHWLISPLWQWRWPPFCPALTPTVHPNHSGEALKVCSYIVSAAWFSTGPGFYALFLFAG